MGIHPAMHVGHAGERSVSKKLPRLVGLTVALFFFSVLDPVALLIVNIFSLLFFFAKKRTLGGIGLFVLLFLVLTQTDGFSPPSMAAFLSGFSFAALLRFKKFQGSLAPALTTGLITLAVVVALFAFGRGNGLIGWVEELKGNMEEALESNYHQLEGLGVFEPDELVKIKEAMGGMIGLTVTLLPGIVLLNIVLANVLGLTIFKYLDKDDHRLPVTRELKYFTFDDTFVWGLIGGLLPLILPLPRGVEVILLNVLMVVILFYLLRGLAIGVYWLRSKGISAVFIGIMYLFLFFLLPPVFLVSLFLPGILDTWYDFRSLHAG